jgi:hypothetical protein
MNLMNRHVGRRDLAAPAPDAKRSCERCFAQISAHDITCPECGAPTRTDQPYLVADAPAHRELSEANLLRVRGEIEQAERKCLAILRKFPNDPGAHTLLGDICFDRGDWHRAIEWYELALELNPSSMIDREKLAEARIRQDESAYSSTIDQIGLSQQPSSAPWVAAGMMGIIAVLAFAAWTLSTLKKQPQAGKGTEVVVSAPQSRPAPGVTTHVQPVPQSDSAPAEPDAGGATATDSASPMVPGTTDEDRTIAQLLQSRSVEGSRLMDVAQDPQTKAVTLTFSVKGNEDFRRIGAVLARDTFGQAQDALIVTLYGVDENRKIFRADATRVRLRETEDPTWLNANSAQDAWISHILQNVWTANEN